MESPEIRTSSPTVPDGNQAVGIGYFIRRITAQVLDLGVCLAIYLVIGMSIAVQTGDLTTSGFNLQGVPALKAIGYTLLACFGYFWLTEGLFSRTFGKMALGLRVTRSEGRSAGILGSLIRNLLRPIDALPIFYLFGFVAIVITKTQQRLGDMAAKTFVKPVQGKGLVFAGSLLLLLAYTLGAWGTYHFYHQGGGGKLSLHQVRFADEPDGKEIHGPFKPGQEFYLLFDLGPLALTEHKQTNALVTFVASDSQGRNLLEPVPLEITETVPKSSGASPSVPIRFQFRLPAYAEGGRYKIKVDALDRVTNASTQLFVPFSVKGPDLSMGASLGYGDYQYLDANKKPKPSPDYQRGQTVHSKFLIRGFQLGPNSHAKLRLALTVKDSGGNVLLHQPDLVSIDEDFYYPPSYFPVTTRVDLPPAANPGAYTMVYELFDELAGKQTSWEKEFFIVTKGPREPVKI